MWTVSDLVCGVIDPICMALGPDLTSSGRRLEQLLTEGELVPGTIYAHRIKVNSETSDDYEYGLDLKTLGGPQRVTVRQHLQPRRELACLGATVWARWDGKRVTIDWPETLRRAGASEQEIENGTVGGAKTLRKPLLPGIQDGNSNRKRLAKGTPVTATIVSAEPVEIFGMPSDVVRLTVSIDEPGGPRTVQLSRERVPYYAETLAVAGAKIPAAVDPKKPDRVTLDWPKAAELAAR